MLEGNMPRPRLILIPGMGADERLFAPQRLAGLDFDVPRLLEPVMDETMRTYADRIARELSLDEPCVVGGASMGGMIACEIAAIRRVERVILIASCPSEAGLRPSYRAAEWCLRRFPDPVLRTGCQIGSRLVEFRDGRPPEISRLVMDMLESVSIRTLKRMSRMIVNWRSAAPVTCKVHHIHGERDHVIPMHRVRPDEVVPGGGHLINLTHAAEVNSFIASCLASCPAGE
jgi:pimeloyl-ACP methyl ester carboxylesterase